MCGSGDEAVIPDREEEQGEGWMDEDDRTIGSSGGSEEGEEDQFTSLVDRRVSD